ncbi:MAG: serine hydrolase domain-containing protein [Bacteroidota bacterium]|nr:serine hydrolase domain-containing protein [Bacteroidota bacterium]
MKALGYLFISVLLFISCGQAAQPPRPVVAKTDSVPPPGEPAALNAIELHRYTSLTAHFFDSIIAGRFNGSVLVAKNGTILYERYKGFKYPERKKDSLNEHTPFHLASTSKTFTAMSILKLWQDGKLDIHDPVSKYLAGFPFPATTVQMLLSHRSGLYNYVHFMDRSGWDKRKFLSNGDVLQYIISHPHEVQAAQPGKHFEYSNTNYALLALIIEKVSGLPYADFLAKTFFQPLQMQDSYVFKLSDTATAMKSYYQSGRKYRMEFLDLVYGDKNVFSTVRDLYKWDQALRSGQIFTKGVMDSAYTPYSFEKPGKRNYGLGWRMLLEPNGKRLIYHNGWWHGNRTVFIRMLDEDATIIALCNNDYKKIYSAKRLCDLFGDYRQGTELFEEAEPDANGSGGSGGDPHLAQSTQTTQATQAATPPSPTHRVHRRRRHHTAHPVHTT